MEPFINWDKVIKKEARGINDDDLGEVQSIGTNYVITVKGIANKKTYYIPKYLVEGYDGHNLWFKVSKRELKDTFSRNSPPKVEEYSKYNTGAAGIGAVYQASSSVTGQETVSVPPDIENRVPMIERKKTVAEGDNEPAVLNWDNIVNKSVRTTDNEPIGSVVAVTSGSIVVTSIGTRNEYYIPQSYVQRYDGAEVFLKLPLAAMDDYKI
jgi:hypothetical protein